MKAIAVVLIASLLVVAGLWRPALAEDEEDIPVIKLTKEPISLQDRKEIEALVRELLRSIHSRSYADILKRISARDGLETSDYASHSKVEIEQDLWNRNSWISEDLYELPDPELIQKCKAKSGKTGRIFVSHYAYYEEFGENSTLHLHQVIYELHGKSEPYYIARVGVQKAKSGCQYEMWPFGLRRIDGVLYWTALPL